MKKLFKVILILIPFSIGLVGFLSLDDMSLSWALYHTIRLYGLDTDVENINLLVEIARWTAPIVTMSVVLYYIKNIWYRIINSIRSLGGESCSVYGDTTDAILFLESLGNKGIKGSLNKPFKSKYHVFFGDNIEGILRQISRRPFEKLINNKPSRYHTRVQVSGYGSYKFNNNNKNISTFSMEENISQLYWKKHPSKPEEKIGIIGGGNLLSSIIDEALMVNIFDTNQRIEYHVWDSQQLYSKTHFMIDEMVEMTHDRFITYNESWKENLSILKGMDRLIICSSEGESITIGLMLVELLPKISVHVYTRFQDELMAIISDHRLSCFGKKEDILNQDVIINESIRDTAKKIHEHYKNKYNSKDSWEDLSGFHMISNLSAASYFPIINQLYQSGKTIDKLTELEHIRWGRLHYRFNWKYGKNKDFELKTHPCLVPFNKLSAIEQKKDEENVRLALKVEVNDK